MTNETKAQNNLPNKGLTLTILFEGQSLNYDEGFGNLAVLKKLNRGSGRAFSYMSRQALRYSIVNQGIAEKSWNYSKVIKGKSDRGKGSVTQLQDSIDKSEESDLFGYMRTSVPISGAIKDETLIKEKSLIDAAKTEDSQEIPEKMKKLIESTIQGKKKKEATFKEINDKLDEIVKIKEITPDEKEEFLDKLKKILGQKTATLVRTTPVKLTPAIALEPFASNTELLTNKFQADKIQETPNMANIEHQRSIYRYTICIDLHRIGTEADEIGTRISPEGGLPPEDEDFKKYRDDTLRKTQIDPPKRAKRICNLLDVVRDLYRDIRGRREDLKPLFLIGGIYESCNPYFENLINIEWKT
jgi:CRISPR-associated autoregulator DevR family